MQFHKQNGMYPALAKFLTCDSAVKRHWRNAACTANRRLHAPVAQLDRALPSEGRGHRFESCRVRQSSQTLIEIGGRENRSNICAPSQICPVFGPLADMRDKEMAARAGTRSGQKITLNDLDDTRSDMLRTSPISSGRGRTA